MNTFTGYEYDNDAKPTGREFVYMAPTRQEAVANCLYEERLKNASAFIGPSGVIVHTNGRSIVFPQPKAPR